MSDGHGALFLHGNPGNICEKWIVGGYQNTYIIAQEDTEESEF